MRSSTGAAATIAMKTDNVYKAARQYELMTAFGTDVLFSVRLRKRKLRFWSAWRTGSRRPRCW